MNTQQAGAEGQPIFGTWYRNEGGLYTADPDYYAILQVSGSADQEVIRAAYRSLARKYHPDQSGASSPARMRQINEAYEALGDPVRRRAYDQSRIGQFVDLTDTSYRDHYWSDRTASMGRDSYVRQPQGFSSSWQRPSEETSTCRTRADGSHVNEAGLTESRSEDDLAWVSWLALVSLIIIVIAVAGWGLATLPFGGSDFSKQSSSFLGSSTILLLSLGIDTALAFTVVLAWWRRVGSS